MKFNMLTTSLLYSNDLMEPIIRWRNDSVKESTSKVKNFSCSLAAALGTTLLSLVAIIEGIVRFIFLKINQLLARAGIMNKSQVLPLGLPQAVQTTLTGTRFAWQCRHVNTSIHKHDIGPFAAPFNFFSRCF